MVLEQDMKRYTIALVDLSFFPAFNLIARTRFWIKLAIFNTFDLFWIKMLYQNYNMLMKF